MSEETDYGEDTNICTTYRSHHDLTKREYFAALAMQGHIAAGGKGRASKKGAYLPSKEEVAEWSLEYADALIEELNK